MLPIKRILVAWVATALVALPALAENADEGSEESQPTTEARTIYYRSAARKPHDSESSRKVNDAQSDVETCGTVDELDSDDAVQPVSHKARVKPASLKARTIQYSSHGRQVPVWRDLAMAPQPPEMPGGGDPFESPDMGESHDARQPSAEHASPSYSSGEWMSGGESCSDGCSGCDMYCDPCGCNAFGGARSFIFGEYLYLQAVGVDMAHAEQQLGTGGPGTVPMGRVGTVAPDFEGAYRVGFGVAVSPVATVGATYTNFSSHATDFLSAPAGVGGTVSSLVLHPGTTTAGSTSTQVFADLDVDFQLADLEYKRLVAGGCGLGSLYCTVGARYGQLNQRFSQLGSFAQPTGEVLTSTNIEFDGGGFRGGFEGERRLGGSRVSAYGKGLFSVLFGHFRSDYTQFNTTTTIVEAASNWNDNRAVPMLEYEAGLSFTSYNGRWRTSTGYYAAFWFNSVSTGEWVRAVQTSDFTNVGQTVSFNGLVSRLEYRF